MPAVQTKYDERHGYAYNGLVANTTTCDVDSYRADNELQYGRAVSYGANDDSVQAGVASTNVFAGFTVKDPTQGPTRGDKYEEGAHTSVMWRGEIWAEVHGAVRRGNAVRVIAGSGIPTQSTRLLSEGTTSLSVTSGDRTFNAPGPNVTISGAGVIVAPTVVAVLNASNLVSALNITNVGLLADAGAVTITIDATNQLVAGSTAPSATASFGDSIALPNAVFTTGAGHEELAKIRVDGSAMGRA